MKKISKKVESKLWLRLIKENESFEDLVDARNEVVRTMGHHEVVKRALLSELDKWDAKIETMFNRLAKKEITIK